VQAHAIYEGQYFLGTSIARPLIAKAQIDVARHEHARAVSHGATGKGNDQIRFELTYASIAPDLKVIAPWREWNFTGRTEMIRYAKRHGIPVPVTVKKPYSMDRNLLHISYESGILENPWTAPPKDMFLLTQSPEKAPGRSVIIEIEFEQGRATGLKTGQGRMRKLTPGRMVKALNQIGGKHGIGRVDMVENRFVGMKSRGVYETPGGTILYAAHRQMESITLDREAMHLRDSLIPDYARMIYNGFWYTPEREALQALVTETQRNVTGVVRLKLYKGNITALGRKSEFSLYREDVASMEEAGGYDQADASGFIKLQGLRLSTRRKTQGRPNVGRKSRMKLD